MFERGEIVSDAAGLEPESAMAHWYVACVHAARGAWATAAKQTAAAAAVLLDPNNIHKRITSLEGRFHSSVSSAASAAVDETSTCLLRGARILVAVGAAQLRAGSAGQAVSFLSRSLQHFEHVAAHVVINDETDWLEAEVAAAHALLAAAMVQHNNRHSRAASDSSLPPATDKDVLASAMLPDLDDLGGHSDAADGIEAAVKGELIRARGGKCFRLSCRNQKFRTQHLFSSQRT